MFQKILKHKYSSLLVAIFICFTFFIAYAVLSVVRHDHYGSFGYDLGINNQVVWRYSTFQPPITTSDPFPSESKLVTHVELVYALIAPFYWIWSSSHMLLIVDVALLCLSGLAIFLMAREKNLHVFLSLALVFSYLMFYGVQNAMWFDVHSSSFAAGFIAWFLYFLTKKNTIGTVIFFFLAITAKENIAFITFFIGLVYLLSRRDKLSLFLIGGSIVYLAFIFYIYFPFIVQKQYLYQNHAGLLSNLNLQYMINTAEKLHTILFSLASFGFVPLFDPILLIPAAADLATYFVIGSDLPGAQGIFMHYRVTLAPLLTWATIMAINKYKLLNNKYLALYVIFSALFLQYTLHLPLSYLTKSWFWTEPSGVKNIQALRKTFIRSDAIVAQNNLIPHISQRDKIYTLYPEKKRFNLATSPCGAEVCDWFRWHGNPTFLFIDTSPEWDIRHYLTNREDYIKGLKNIEKAGVVEVYEKRGSAVIYKVNRSPN